MACRCRMPHMGNVWKGRLVKGYEMHFCLKTAMIFCSCSWVKLSTYSSTLCILHHFVFLCIIGRSSADS